MFTKEIKLNLYNISKFHYLSESILQLVSNYNSNVYVTYQNNRFFSSFTSSCCRQEMIKRLINNRKPIEQSYFLS